MSTYTEAEEIEFFNECIESLAEEVFRQDNGIRLNFFDLVDEQTIRKSAWVASILASSPDHDHKRKALAFAILAYSRHRGDEKEALYERYLYIILSRIGDLPAIGSFVDEKEREDMDQSLLSSFDSVLSYELNSYRSKFRLDEDRFLSEFQYDIRQALSAGNDVAISGPTSSGKSFILQEYIRENVEEQEEFEVIYVVPTRALIAEVGAKLKKRHDDVNVKTSANFTEEDKNSNVFLVVTPERCLKLLRGEIQDLLNPDLIFFDEFQNLEDGERGVLFENIVESLREMWPDSQMVVAGPYLDDPDLQLERITGREVTPVTTVFTPILQLKIYLTIKAQSPGNRRLKVTIQSPTGNPVSFKIDEPSGLNLTQYNKNKGVFYRNLINAFGEGERNLVYSRRKDWAETWAKRISGGNEPRDLSDETQQLLEFLSDSIHSEYTLIDSIKRGVAFHHRMVPKIARTKIEEIYRDNELDDLNTIVSTSTLLEGVNFPAENIFIHDPAKGGDELSNFDFKNLIGRVGRLNQNLFGSIFCIETEDDEWANEMLEDKGNKDIEAVTDNAIRSDFDRLLDAVESENVYKEEVGKFRYTAIILRNKALRGDEELSSYLGKKELSNEEVERLATVTSQRVSGTELPTEILRRNPTIDPVQQDELFKSVRRNPDKWIIAEHRSGYDYDTFLEVTRQLNEIFHFSRDAGRDFEPVDPEVNQGDIKPIIVTANKWLRSHSFRSMIEDMRGREGGGDKPVNDSIRDVMEIVSDDIRFVLVKYYRILTDILEETDVIDSEWMLTFDQMLEMGTFEFHELDLMSMGVDRAVVIDLPMPSNVEDPVEWLEENRYRIPSFYEEHLEKQDVL